jgi:hypothetical protein
MVRTVLLIALSVISSECIAQSQPDHSPANVQIEDALEQQFTPEWAESWFDECQAIATKKELRGDERREFYVVCLARSQVAPLTVWVDCLNAAAYLSGLDRGKAVSSCVTSRGGVPSHRKWCQCEHHALQPTAFGGG